MPLPTSQVKSSCSLHPCLSRLIIFVVETLKEFNNSVFSGKMEVITLLMYDFSEKHAVFLS